MSVKICNTCNISKSIDEYTNNKRNSDGKEKRCKVCISDRAKQNRERLREAQRRWREKNPDYMKEYGKRAEIIKYQREYYKDHSQAYKDRKEQWRKDNPEREARNRKKYNQENRDKLNEYHRQWKKQKRDNDIHYKLKQNTSRRIRYELNNLLKGKKTKRTTEYIGCTIEKLKEHLEGQFDSSMNWGNYGTYWHIDHIIPCVAWDLASEEDNKYCWNYRNLQPLNSHINQSKKDKYEQTDKEEYIERLKVVFENEI